MAKRSTIIKNDKRKKMSLLQKDKRKQLKTLAFDENLSFEERLQAQQKLSQMPRNGSLVRFRNRCSLTGRPRGNLRKFGLSRNKLRELASWGQIPGLVKSSW